MKPNHFSSLTSYFSLSRFLVLFIFSLLFVKFFVAISTRFENVPSLMLPLSLALHCHLHCEHPLLDFLFCEKSKSFDSITIWSEFTFIDVSNEMLFRENGKEMHVAIDSIMLYLENSFRSQYYFIYFFVTQIHHCR